MIFRLACILCVPWLILVSSSRSFARMDQVSPDSIRAARIESSSAQPTPSTKAPKDSTEIRYSADYISYTVEDSTLVLTGNAQVQYGPITLTAGKIRFNTHTEILFAEEGPDSATGGDDTRQLPTLRDPQGTLVGDRMQYNIKTGHGRILGGRTKYDQGFFEGQRIRVDNENILRIEQGSYSTCDRPDHKHYWLRSGKTKIIPDDKAIVKDMVAYVYGVPVFYFPFYVLPLKRGRHSGFTVPTYGTREFEGTYVRNLGYYWAASEYWDFKAMADFTSARGMLLRPSFRYADARRLRGDVRGSYQSGYDFTTTGWDVQANHWQELRPDLRISGRAEFANSLSFVQSTTRGPDPGRIQRALRSNLSVDKTWGQKSMNLSLSETSQTGKPVRPTTSLSLRLPTRPLFAPEQRRSTNGFPSFTPSTPAQRAWYQSLLFGYSGNAQDRRQSSTATRQTLTNRFNLSSQQTVGGWLKMQPRTDYTETWSRQTDQGFDRQNTYSTGVRANTTLYGMFQPNIGRLQAVRHVMTPSVSFSQSGPDNVSRSVSFNMNNILQAKTVRDEQERKFDVLLANFSTGYNFKATTRPLSDLSTSLRVPSRSVNVDARFTHDFYEPTVNTLRSPWLERASVTTSINLRGQGAPTQFAGTTPSGLDGVSSQDGYFDNGTNIGRSSSAFGDDRFDEDFDRVKGPWSVTLTHRYSISRTGPAESFLTSSHLITASNRFNMERLTDALRVSNRFTRMWRVEHSVNYDVRQREIRSQNFSFLRNLHCWELFIRWTPNGLNKGIYFRLNILAHPEIKLEQQRLSQ